MMKEAMNSRERILSAVNHQTVDRVPTDIWMTGEVQQKLQKHFGAGVDISAALHVDGMGNVGPAYVGPALPTVPEGESVDDWGIRTKKMAHEGGVYEEQIFAPLAAATTIDDLEAYNWPGADWFDATGMAEAAAKQRKTHAVSFGYCAPFFYHNMLRGLEQSLMDPLLNPEFTHHMLGRISDSLYAIHRKCFEACEGLIDITQVTDDLGSQSGPLISLKVYREFYLPHHKRFIALAHEFGVKVLHHDDGAIRTFLPDLVEAGIDILNPIQWRCPGMELEGLKSDFGRTLCFHGGIDNQQTLPFGTPEEVRAEVRRCIDVLASDSTGYILAPCHNLQVVSPVENIIAMYDEAWNYGKF